MNVKLRFRRVHSRQRRVSLFIDVKNFSSAERSEVKSKNGGLEMVREREELSEEEKRALRGSKFAPLPSLATSSSRSQPSRLAHPGGPLTTNKAAALAKFLDRKLKEPDGLSSINPDILELAVKNAKDTVFSSGSSNSGRIIRHVNSFGDSEDSFKELEVGNSEPKELEKTSKKKKKNKKIKKGKKQQSVKDGESAMLKRPKKKLKL